MTVDDSDVTSTKPPAPENPILDETELARWAVTTSRPVPKANSRLVFVDNKGRVLAPEQPMTRSEVVWGGLRRMYEVDMREHRARFRAQVPCREKGFSFDVEFELSWRVVDPAQIVRDGCTDVGPVYRSYLIERVSEQSERYGLEDRLAAEQALKRTLAGESRLREGIQVRNCALVLKLDTEPESHFKDRTLTAFATEKRHAQHAADLDQAKLDESTLAARDEIETLKGELRGRHQTRQLRQQEEINALKHKLDEQAMQHELALDRARRLAEAKAELEIADLKQKLELQQAQQRLAIEREEERQRLSIKVERMDFYGKALESGDIKSLIPILLDEHPEDIGQLINLLMGEHRDAMENTRKVMEATLEAGVFNGRDLDATKRAVLQKLLQGISVGALGFSLDHQKPAAIEPEPSSSGDIDDQDRDV